jgi:hypothetical protein
LIFQQHQVETAALFYERNGINMIKEFGHPKKELGYIPERLIPIILSLALFLKIHGYLTIEMLLSISPAFIFQLGLEISIETRALVDQRGDVTSSLGS